MLTRAALCSGGTEPHLRLSEEPVRHEEVETGDSTPVLSRTLALERSRIVGHWLEMVQGYGRWSMCVLPVRLVQGEADIDSAQKDVSVHRGF